MECLVEWGVETIAIVKESAIYDRFKGLSDS
jgi:hypothetical protein